MEKTYPAVVFNGVGHMSLEQRPKPALLDERDAVVQVTLSSICQSDIHIKHGSVPRAVPGTVVGHEFVGVVTETGSAVKKIKPGMRVAGNVETFCGECYFCKRGYVNNCTDPHGGWALGCRIDGGQTAYVRVPFADNGLEPIPDSVSDEKALFTGDILATGYWAAEISEIKPADSVAVIGAGPTGMCTLACCRLYTPGKLIVIDVDNHRLALAKEKGLADITLNPLECDVKAEILKLTEGRGADRVLEVAGAKNTFAMAYDIARANATVTVVALYDTPQSLPLPSMYGKNLTFKTGGVDGCKTKEIMALIEKGVLDLSFLITHSFPMEKAMEAYELFESKREQVIKVALRP